MVSFRRQRGTEGIEHLLTLVKGNGSMQQSAYMLDLMIIERHVHCSRGLLIRLGHGKAGKKVYDWLMQKRRLELVVAAGDSKNILSHSC
jgi:hypothetical protein